MTTKNHLSIDMSGNGMMKLLDLSANDMYKKYIDKKVLNIFLWQDQFNVVAGIEFEFDSLFKLYAFNAGDTLIVNEILPVSVDGSDHWCRIQISPETIVSQEINGV